LIDGSLPEYGSFIKYIKELIYRRQYEAMKRVNTELILLYWEIGGEITRQQKEKGWGKSVVAFLSKELQIEFPGIQGFSTRNLWRMRNFYVEYSQNKFLPPSAADLSERSHTAFLPPLVAEISWTKNYVIMEKCKDPAEREFYIKMTKRYGWTKDVLINNIENRAFEKYLTSQTNFDETVPEKYRLQAKLAVKDNYNFDFIEMGIEHSEAELEAGIIKNIRAFLAEMGSDFCFIDTQYHLEFADADYYIDLLLFHRRLRSLIAIDLKIGEFLPEYVGKMQYYLTVLDETVRLPDENSSIGIIICKSKNRTRVEYALTPIHKPIGVATYSYYDTMPDDVRLLLPSPDEIAKIVTEFDADTEDVNGDG
jgi:predicted nuclease of restriction endonuclease-like (RecB) superfamily